jgi:YggT family protein
MSEMVFNIAQLILSIMSLAIIARALLSWVMPVGRDRWTALLVSVTEPILAPIRSVTARLLPIPIDISPILAILLIYVLQQLLSRAYPG